MGGVWNARRQRPAALLSRPLPAAALLTRVLFLSRYPDEAVSACLPALQPGLGALALPERPASPRYVWPR